ncbi:hypothetical protein D3C81_652400 [compost metagenome]
MLWYFRFQDNESVQPMCHASCVRHEIEGDISRREPAYNQQDHLDYVGVANHFHPP